MKNYENNVLKINRLIRYKYYKKGNKNVWRNKIRR